MSSRELRYLLITNLHEGAKLTSLQICLVFERNLQTKYVAESRVEIYTESLKPEIKIPSLRRVQRAREDILKVAGLFLLGRSCTETTAVATIAKTTQPFRSGHQMN